MQRETGAEAYVRLEYGQPGGHRCILRCISSALDCAICIGNTIRGCRRQCFPILLKALSIR